MYKIDNPSVNQSSFFIFVITLLIGFTLSSVAADNFPGDALDFDGSDDYVVVTELTNLSGAEITIEYWFKGSNTKSAVRQQSDIYNYIVSGWADLHILSNDGGTSNGIAIGSGAEDGNWHHISMTWQQNTTNGFKSYLDGALVAQRDSSDTPIPNLSSNLYFGSWNGTSEFMTGQLDEVRIWNVARTATQIRENIHLTLNGTESGLVSYYQFNEGAGTTASDITGGHDGTLQNGTSWVDSTVAIGSGGSYSQTVNSTGSVIFPGTNLSMNFTAKSGTDDFTVTKITLSPNIVPSDVDEVFDSQYWVIHQFGGGTFTADITFEVNENLSADDEANPAHIKLFKRNSTADGDWSPITRASSVDAAANTVAFRYLCPCSQFILVRDTDVQADDRPELLLMGIDDGAGENYFGLRIGRNVDFSGETSDWQGDTFPGLGLESTGGGLAMGYINDNNIPDVVFMYYNEGSGTNDLRYKVGFDFNVYDGSWCGWSDPIYGPILSDYSAGGGATIGYINDNERPDLVLMGIQEHTGGANNFWYYVGWDLDIDGNPAEWTTNAIPVGGIGWSTAGGGATIGYIDDDPRPDLILMGVDAPSGADYSKCMVGLNLDTDGRTQNWNSVLGRQLGYSNDGGGATLGYVNDNGIPDLILMAIDNPSEANYFWYHVCFDLGIDGQPESLGNIIIGPMFPGWETDGGGAALISEPLTAINLTSPTIGSNGKVNVALYEAVTFKVDFLENRFNATIAGAQWRKIVAGDTSANDGFEQTSTGEKQYTFTDVGDYIIYCRVIEEIQGRKSVSRTIAIPVCVWNRPTVASIPPQDRIDAGDVSWFAGKYVGVKEQSVRMMAAGATQNNDPNEQIERFLWDFNSDWSTVELEQPAGEVVSHIWDTATQSSQIRCKAITNYGVKSHANNETGQTFNLTIYDTVQVSAGGPYSGRANESLRLQGSMQNSYYNAVLQYQWRVDSVDPIPQFKGSAVDNGDSIQFTEAVNSQNGQAEYSDLPLSNYFSVTGEFWTGGGTGAGAFYIYLWANGTPLSEDEDKGQYAIAFNDSADEIRLLRAGALLANATLSLPLDDSVWRPFRVVFNEGKFQVYLDHWLKLTYNDGTGYEALLNNPANRFSGFGAYTGTQNNIHRVRNVTWTTGTPVATNNLGEAENVWTQEGTFLAGMTATVTTPEGIVLEGTELAEVRVEAGVPTAMPGGPYRGGIAGGNYSQVGFLGNHPDFVEADDVGKIQDWLWFFSDAGNNALKFDGQDDYVVVDPVSGFPTDAVTLEFWMKSSDLDGTPVSYASSSHTNELVISNPSNFEIAVAGVSTGPTEINAGDGKWHHIAVTWQSVDGQLKLYIDGAEVYQGNIATGSTLTGNGAFSAGEAFAGVIDEALLWGEVRSQSAIREDMGDKLTGEESGIVLYWQFEEGQGTFAGDSSIHDNNGTLMNMGPTSWTPEGRPTTVYGVWNPNHYYLKWGKYEVGLKVLAESGKWSSLATTEVDVADGRIAGYVRAADLRTPVRDVKLILASASFRSSRNTISASRKTSPSTIPGPGLY